MVLPTQLYKDSLFLLDRLVVSLSFLSVLHKENLLILLYERKLELYTTYFQVKSNLQTQPYLFTQSKGHFNYLSSKFNLHSIPYAELFPYQQDDF